MNTKLIIAIIAITMALIFYTYGVFAERKSHCLKKLHVVVFWLGLLCDTTGTITMSIIARGGETSKGIGVHGITGGIAIVLMIFHAVWATITLCKKKEKQMETFHKFSMIVWIIWLVPYFIGMFVGMSN